MASMAMAHTGHAVPRLPGRRKKKTTKKKKNRKEKEKRKGKKEQEEKEEEEGEATAIYTQSTCLTMACMQQARPCACCSPAAAGK